MEGKSRHREQHIAKVVCLGVSEKFDMNRVQEYVIGTESGEQSCCMNLGQMLLSFYLLSICYCSWGKCCLETAY